MRAILSGGPVDGEIREVPRRPPAHIDVEVEPEDEDFEPIPPGGAFPEMTFERHRYVLSNVDPLEDPQAKYSYLQRMPSEPVAEPGEATW